MYNQIIKSGIKIDPELEAQFQENARIQRDAEAAIHQRALVNEIRKELRYTKKRKHARFAEKHIELTNQLIEEEALLVRYEQAEKQLRKLRSVEYQPPRFYAIHPNTKQPIGPFRSFHQAATERARLMIGELPFE